MVPNVGPREGLASLADEFRYNGNFINKVQRLQLLGYSGWRRIRGDGNCCYRAVGFGFLEQVAAAPPSQRVAMAGGLRHQLATLDFPLSDHAQAHRELLARFDRLLAGLSWDEPAAGHAETTPLGILYLCFCDPAKPFDLALVRALRRLAADWLLRNAHDDDLGGGISFEIASMAQGFDGVAGFCDKVVLPEGVEAEGIVLNALPAVLGMGLRIAYLDRNESRDLPFCDYATNGSVGEGALGMAPVIHMQLRPGHYDLLYFGEERLPETTACFRADARGTSRAVPAQREAQPPSPDSPLSPQRRAGPPTFGAADPSSWEVSPPYGNFQEAAGPSRSEGTSTLDSGQVSLGMCGMPRIGP